MLGAMNDLFAQHEWFQRFACRVQVVSSRRIIMPR